MRSFKRKDAISNKDDAETLNDLAVTIVMNRPPEEVKKVSVMPSPREMLSRKLSKKMISKTNGQTEENEAIRHVDLSSDLIINPPCNGQFSAELQLNKLIEKCQQDIFLHISGMKIDVFSAKEKEEIIENPRKISGKKFELSPVEDMTLQGHLILPMFIDTDSYEFSLDECKSLHIRADIKGTISPRPSRLEVPVPEKIRLVKSLSDCTEYLRRKLTKRLKSDSEACPDSQEPVRKISGSGVASKKISVVSTGSQKSSPTLLHGSTTVKGIFKPFQLLQKEGSKRKVKPNTCRWQINRDCPGKSEVFTGSASRYGKWQTI